MFFYGLLYKNVPMLTDQQELIYICSVRTQDTVWKTCWERRMIETNEEIESGKSVLSALPDDDDDDDGDDESLLYII